MKKRFHCLKISQLLLTYIHVVYYVRNVWTPCLQEQVHREIKLNNPEDKYVVVIKKMEKWLGIYH